MIDFLISPCSPQKDTKGGKMLLGIRDENIKMSYVLTAPGLLFRKESNVCGESVNLTLTFVPTCLSLNYECHVTCFRKAQKGKSVLENLTFSPFFPGKLQI